MLREYPVTTTIRQLVYSVRKTPNFKLNYTMLIFIIIGFTRKFKLAE